MAHRLPLESLVLLQVRLFDQRAPLVFQLGSSSLGRPNTCDSLRFRMGGWFMIPVSLVKMAPQDSNTDERHQVAGGP